MIKIKKIIKDFMVITNMEKKNLEVYKMMIKTMISISKNKKLKVAAIMVKDNRIIASGVNGYLTKLPEKAKIINNHDLSAVHAEMNLICFCAKNGIKVEGCTIIISHYPCHNCTKHLYQSGVKEIYYAYDYKNEENFFKKYIKIQKIK